MKSAYTAHRDWRKSVAAMRENVIAYKEAGGSFRKPLVIKT